MHTHVVSYDATLGAVAIAVVGASWQIVVEYSLAPSCLQEA
ncbi:hypothetical protein [Sansalvadorimonas verongulae]|nr:hypothetical protein [Sansalvadorimonas verongulae]